MWTLAFSTRIFGLAALLWACLAVPELWTATRFDRVVSRILAGEPFSSDELDRQIAAISATAPFTVRSARMEMADPVVRLRALESALDRADVGDLDDRMTQVSLLLHRAIDFRPADPLLWTLLYGLDSLRTGPNAQTSNYLRLSYLLGPLEGTVALRRNALALAGFAGLDRATQDEVVAEFAALLDSLFTNVAAKNLAGPGWAVRDRLLNGLDDVDIGAKRTLVKMFGAEGIRLDIRGMPVTEERPWRK